MNNETSTENNFSRVLLNKLSDADLHSHTVRASNLEKDSTLRLLEYLAEVDRRRIYATKGFSTLWEYVHLSLKYSESQSSERVNAMRLMVRVPEVRAEIASQKLTLTAAAKIASFVKREKTSAQNTVKLLEEVRSKSTRELEHFLLSRQTVVESRPDRLKPVGPQTTRISFDADPEFLDLLTRAQEIIGKNHLGLSSVLKPVLKEFIKKRTLSLKQPNERAPSASGVSVSAGSDPDGSLPGGSLSAKPLEAYAKKTPSTSMEGNLEQSANSLRAPEVSLHLETKPLSQYQRYISAPVRCKVRMRSRDQCEFIDKDTGKRCDSRYGLQFDHIQPIAFGGLSNFENIRHLCRPHNIWLAIQNLGADKMRRYLHS